MIKRKKNDENKNNNEDVFKISLIERKKENNELNKPKTNLISNFREDINLFDNYDKKINIPQKRKSLVVNISSLKKILKGNNLYPKINNNNQIKRHSIDEFKSFIINNYELSEVFVDKLIEKIFRECLKEVLNDIIDNNVTF